MSHYHMGNWNKAIDSLSLVGTEVADIAADDLGRIEIGQRFYAKIVDADVPVMRKLDQPVQASVKVSSGDTEIITGVPVPGKSDEMLASAPTALGTAKPNDGVLQMVGGDTLEVTYLDDSTLDGKKGVPRTGKVRAVSTGTVGFYLGDNSTPAYIAYPGQPQVVMLRDADLDTSPAAEAITLTVKSLYKVEAKDAAESDELLDIFALKDDEKDQWIERDSITVTLTETGDGAEIRSGVFLGKVPLAPLTEGTSPIHHGRHPPHRRTRRTLHILHRQGPSLWRRNPRLGIAHQGFRFGELRRHRRPIRRLRGTPQGTQGLGGSRSSRRSRFHL